MDRASRGRQCARVDIDLKRTDVICCLISRDQILSCRIDVKVAGYFSAGETMSHRRQFSCHVVKLKNCQTVMATIGNIDKFSGGMNNRFGGRIAGDVVGQCR